MAILYEKKDHIAYITLNRPGAKNAIDPETVVELVDIWKDFDEDNNIRCGIITGRGDVFCSGADLKKLIPLVTGTREAQTDADRMIIKDPMLIRKALLRDLALKKPLIAAINGDAIAGGMELLYSTDIRIAAKGARFGLQEVKWAIVPLMGSTVRLPAQLPFAKAMEILLTGELVTAEELYSFGFINRVVEPSGVMNEAERFARIIASNGPLAVRAVKASVLASLGRPTTEALAKELEIGIPVFFSQDAKEGPRAFAENRKPEYKGE